MRDWSWLSGRLQPLPFPTPSRQLGQFPIMLNNALSCPPISCFRELTLTVQTVPNLYLIETRYPYWHYQCSEAGNDSTVLYIETFVPTGGDLLQSLFNTLELKYALACEFLIHMLCDKSLYWGGSYFERLISDTLKVITKCFWLLCNKRQLSFSSDYFN